MNREEQHEKYVRRKVVASAACAAGIAKRIKAGNGSLEDVPCFCGGVAAKVVAEHDRYGIPLRIVICEECALIRVNPRFTQEALAQFYNEEYRILNFPRYLSNIISEEEEQIALAEQQEKKGRRLVEQIVEHAIEPPEVVVDFGCHLGHMLTPFKRKFGAETWGIEIDKVSAEKARDAGHEIVESVDELIDQGLRADFIIAHDIVEHLTDLREMEKFGKIMKPESVLYVWTPGLFRFSSESLFQVAHNYYFVANTLNWVMSEMGFTPNYLDEECAGFFVYEGAKAPRVDKPVDWVEYQVDEIGNKDVRKVPPFRGVCKFSKKELYDNIEKNLAHKRPDIYEITGSKKGPVIVIAGGPSVDGQIDEIKKLQAGGASVMVIARMYPWCAKHGIKPDYVVSLDCSEDQEKGFADLQPGVIYLLSSVTRPSIFEMLKNELVYTFDCRDDIKSRDIRQKAGYRTVTVMNGGGSVSVLCVSLAFNLGFRDLHIFGFDCMMSTLKKTHAADISGISLPPRVLFVLVEGEEIITTPTWLEFARQILDLISVAHDENFLDSVKFYGESLVNRLWDGQFHEEATDVQVS